MLRNAVYIGTLVYAKSRYSAIGKKKGKVQRAEADRVVVENIVPAIVPRELWDAAQARHGTRKFGVGRPWHTPYLLSGLIECGHCHKRFQAQKQTRGRVAAYYICGGYIASGASVCDAPRIPTTYLEDAVLDGIQKRLERALDPERLRRQIRELLQPDEDAPDPIHGLDARLAETRSRIGRLVQALASGSDDLPSVRAALVDLERQAQQLERELQAARARAGDAAPARVDAIAGALVQELGQAAVVLREGEPEERKRVVRCFLQGIRIEKATRRAVLRWYRLPQASFVKLVELRGVGLDPDAALEDETLPLPTSRRTSPRAAESLSRARPATSRVDRQGAQGGLPPGGASRRS